MSRTLFTLGGLFLVVGGLSVGAHKPELSAAPTSLAPSSDDAPLVCAAPAQVILWNEDHCHVTELIGEWRVRSAPKGSRMRPQHDECYIRILSDVDGQEHEFKVTTAGEVYIAHGWIAVNQVNQESWQPLLPGEGAASGCSDPLDCIVSYTKGEVVKVSFQDGTCWRAALDSGTGCDFSRTCASGSQGCNVGFTLLVGVTESFEDSCGSGKTVSQCTDSDGETWICYCG